MVHLRWLNRIAVSSAASFVLALGVPAATTPAFAQGDGWIGTMTASYQLTGIDISGDSTSITYNETVSVNGPNEANSTSQPTSYWRQMVSYNASWDIKIHVHSSGGNCDSEFTHNEVGSGDRFVLQLYVSGAQPGTYDSYRLSAVGTSIQVDVPGCPGWTRVLDWPGPLYGTPTAYPLPSDPAHLSGTDTFSTGLTSTWDLTIDPAFLPTPIVPEAPIALLLPLGAGVLLAGSYFISRRRRSRPNAA